MTSTLLSQYQPYRSPSPPTSASIQAGLRLNALEYVVWRDVSGPDPNQVHYGNQRKTNRLESAAWGVRYGLGMMHYHGIGSDRERGEPALTVLRTPRRALASTS